jgi:hypothetical protein
MDGAGLSHAPHREQQALRRDCSAVALARTVLDTVLADNLVDAVIDDPRRRLPSQSSSASRLTAGAAGFLILSQWSERPDR